MFSLEWSPAEGVAILFAIRTVFHESVFVFWSGIEEERMGAKKLAFAQEGMKKTAAIALLVMLLALPLAMLSGCAPSPAESEKVIREYLVEEFDKVKNRDSAFMSSLGLSLMMNQDTDARTTLDSMGFSSDDVAEFLVSDFDYSVDKIDVEGDDAIASMTIKKRAYSDIDDHVWAIAEEVTNDPSLVADMTQQESMEWLGDRVRERMAQTPPDEEEMKLDFSFDPSTRTWKASDATDKKMQTLFQ